MKKKTICELLPALLVIGAAILISSCSPGFGVFSEIQTEKAQEGTDIFKDATVRALGEDGTNYYAVMGKVFYRPKIGGSWKVLAVNGDSDYFCGGFASDGTSIYVAALDNGNTALKGIYQGTVGGTAWSAVIDASALGTDTFDTLFLAGTELFALTHSASAPAYNLYHSSGLAAFASTGLSALADPVLGVKNAGAAFWALTGSKAYTGTAAALTTESTPGSGKTFGGIALDTANKILVTTTDGFLYTNTAGSWSGAAEVDSGVSLGTLIEVPVSANAAAPYRLVIAKNDSSYGYFEYDAATPATVIGNDAGAIFAQTSSSYTTTVHQKPVQAIHYSSTEKTMLIGLSAQGTSTYALYSNKYESGAWSGWEAQ
ncbi:MAG: hypothetical protein CVV53_08315 [Spirochaetae bacterium HGW-Spirochaetae-9]|nr:MAG: hypothetical protein CVV53_08315 [Spirochaetae bacterium HGW-Spirochaetae-9]